MIILNFAHPLTEDQLATIRQLTGQEIDRVIKIESQIDPAQPLAPQIAALVDNVGFTSDEWQTLPILVNPPSLNFSAVVLLAELHGRCGYFPPIIRIRPVPDSLPPRYEVAEIVNLVEVRNQARQRSRR